MKRIAIPFLLNAAIAVFAVASSAAEIKVLHSFGGSHTDGKNPANSGLVVDRYGNLYGTTSFGGARGSGTVFELTLKEDGKWTETTLHSFGSGSGGRTPMGSLVFDASGNLYGTNLFGGIHGFGTVFEVSPAENGKWAETVLHSFDGLSPSAELHGTDPSGAVVFDAAGNLYGTTLYGGLYDFGEVFELSPSEDGKWTETVLHSFKEAENPAAPLILDAAGNLYGITYAGGTHGLGQAFELIPKGNGVWTLTVLHDFGGEGTGDAYPNSGLILDGSGNLYGVTAGEDETSDHGTVFELIPDEGGGWTENILHRFGSSQTGGLVPYGNLVFDKNGNLFGTTEAGGGRYPIGDGYGEIFEFTPDGSGGWTHSVLHTFDLSDGYGPDGSLVIDAASNLYGTTANGGFHGEGTVFELIR